MTPFRHNFPYPKQSPDKLRDVRNFSKSFINVHIMI